MPARLLAAFALVSSFVEASTSLTLSKATYAPGEAITVTWSRNPENSIHPKDWVGIYPSTVTPGADAPASAWTYLNNTRTAPAAGVLSGSFSMEMPVLVTGTYTATLFGSNAYEPILPPVTFTIAATGGPTPPQFVTSPFRLRHTTNGSAYTGCIRGYAKDADAGDILTFSKTSGPAWLKVESNGTLSGTPAATDAGANTFSVTATDIAGNKTRGTFRIEVFQPGAARVDKLRVMSYNLWHGWGLVNNGFRKGLDSIILADADIVCTQESSDNVHSGNRFQPQLVAAELGWHFSRLPNSGDIGVLSRYPIAETFSPTSFAVGARVDLCGTRRQAAQDVIVYSTHLDYQNYGPYKAAEAASTNECTMTEELGSQRDEQSAALMKALESQLDAADKTPVIVCGDFNCPSHLDWTSAAANLHNGKTVAWPATVHFANAGLKDTFRELHPDPLATPGNTWAPIYNGNEPLDRIDMIFAKGSGLKTLSSEVYHTKVETQIPNYSGNHTLVKNNTWPTDHAAVVTEFSISNSSPGPRPTPAARSTSVP